MSTLLALVVLVCAARPVGATTVPGGTAVCVVPITETFTTALRPAPAATTNHLSAGGTATACSGLASALVSFSWSGDTAGGTTCSGPLATLGSGTVTTPLGTTPVSAMGGGSTALQAWTFVDRSATPALAATGLVAWTSPGEVVLCAAGSIATIHLTGLLFVVY